MTAMCFLGAGLLAAVGFGMSLDQDYLSRWPDLMPLMLPLSLALATVTSFGLVVTLLKAL